MESKNNRRKKDRSLSEERLVKAGIETFSKYGFEGATSEMIARKSGINVSLINRYFKSKEGLLSEIVARFIVQRKTRVLEYKPQKTLEAELLKYMQHEFEFDMKNIDFLRIIISRSAIDQKLRQKIKKVVPKDGRKSFTDRLRDLQRQGKMNKKADPVLVQYVIGFQVFALSFIAHVILNLSKKEIESHMKHFIKSYAAGLK